MTTHMSWEVLSVVENFLQQQKRHSSECRVMFFASRIAISGDKWEVPSEVGVKVISRALHLHRLRGTVC